MTQSYRPGFRAALDDLASGLHLWRSWWLLSWQQVRSQYRRTVLGPWWISIQRAIFFAGLSLLFGVLMKQDMRTFVPFVAVGFMMFQFMVTSINSGTTAITGNAAQFKGSSMPLSVLAFRTVAVNLIQLGHDAVVLVIVLVGFRVHVNWTLLLAPLAIALLVLNALAFALWLGPSNARYRDLSPLITSVTGILFFFTPIFWRTQDISARQRSVLTGWNPLTYLLETVRGPLIGMPFDGVMWAGALAVTVANVAVAFWVFSKTRLELAYWVQS